MDTLKPETADAVAEALRWAVAGPHGLEVTGGGTKRAFGKPIEAEARLDLSALSGITLYQPEELVMTALPATPLAEIEAALAEKKQRLAFEPPDLGPLLGAAPGGGTLGGVIACNLAGPRRPMAGAARDHILGFKAVSGRGEAFKSGGRVVKNVTGFDLSKLMAGSFGTLAVLTEVTVKVLPAPPVSRTLLLLGLDDEAAVEAMRRALSGPFDVSGAAHLPPEAAAVSAVGEVSDAGAAVTALRLEGPEPSVLARAESLASALCGDAARSVEGEASAVLWREVRDARLLAAADGEQVWRLSLPPADAPAVARELRSALGGRLFMDWGGGLLWWVQAARDDAGCEAVRRALPGGGHATLVAAEEGVRGRVAVFHPRPAPLEALAARVKEGFDPRGILNPGRL